MDKKAFIDTVRRAQKSAQPLPEYSEADTTSTTATAGDVLAAFERNFAANHGIVVKSAEELAAKLKELGCKSGVADAKLGDTFGLESEVDLSYDFDRSNPDGYDFGISRATNAIAENGVLVLKDCDTADRMATIAPWVHVAVLDKNAVLKTITDGLKDVLENTPYTIWVAGPSKTTDVEGVLVEGVHGPGKQICFLV